MGGALGDHLTGDQAAATQAVFAVTGLKVGFEVIVVLAQLAAQAAIAAEGCAAVLDAHGQN